MFEQPSTGQHWEKQTIQRILLEHIQEQRRARRWNIFFKLMMLVILGFIFYYVFHKEHPQPVITAQDHTAIVDVSGEISSEDNASAENIRKALRDAFDNKHAKGVVLRINSPGGSPVQARQIYDEIHNLRAKHPDVKVYAAIEDMGTSAAYLIAAAADSIYADKTSLVGSIGVKIDSFGFVEGMKKIGVERRAYIAGKYKAILDPFLPRESTEDAFIQEQLNSVHKVFIDNVRQGRGKRLHENPDIFTGLFWTGEQALTLGLIDGFGDARFIANEIIKVDKLYNYSHTENFLDRIAHRVGASIGHVISLNLGLIQRGVR